ncbi:hypothetical protein Lal_00002556 [Lupinus albus]|nr:hypothetical protein Lal_00002556 [Lupinus albus]
MRQAGRFMPEYWEIKNKYSFLEMCKTPEIAADVTMLPVDLLGIDAAILFSDILVTGEAMGGDLSFTAGVGPKFANPQRLNGSIPLIGFAGAPFTVMSYLVEGGSSKDFKLTKLMLHNQPELAHQLLSKIATVTADYLNLQIAAGVNAVQIFDSWAQALSWDDYTEFSHRYIQEIISKLNRKDIPVISFCKGSSVFAPLMAEAKPDVISIDWNVDLLDMKNRLPKAWPYKATLTRISFTLIKSLLDGRAVLHGTPVYLPHRGAGKTRACPNHPFRTNKMKEMARGNFTWTSTQLRLWNELATIILFAIVFLVVLKSALNWIFGVMGIIAFSIILMMAVKIYKRFREKK